MADFSSWAALREQIATDLANQALTVGEYRTPAGQLVRYRSVDELRKLLGWVAEKEAEASAPSGQAYRRAHAVAAGAR